MSLLRDLWQAHPLMWTALAAAAVLVVIAAFLVMLNDIIDYFRSLL